MSRIGHRFISTICASSARNPILWLLATLILSVPTALAVGDIALDTDLIRLLPRTSRAAQSTRELGPLIGGGSYVAVLFEGDDRDQLIQAVETTAQRLRADERIASVEYEYPVDFLQRYRYLLIPHYYLEKLLRELSLPRPAPAAAPSGEPQVENDETYGDRQNRRQVDWLLDHYGQLPTYHESADGRVIGMFALMKRGVTNLGESRALFGDIQEAANDASERFGFWSGVSGTLRNKIDEYDQIVADLSRAGLIAGAAILLTLMLSFRSARVVPVVLYPLALGLLWAFALVPVTVGDLNLITSFLLIVMFGMGVDYSIHLVKRFQRELGHGTPGEALGKTYLSTGTSVAVSALTTALSLSVLALSDFRGFSEFGVVGATSIAMVLLAMFLVMPATLMLGHRWGFLKAVPEVRSRPARVPGKAVTGIVGAAVVGGLALVPFTLAFDYDFDNMRFNVRRDPAVGARSGLVYRTTLSPAAVLVAADLETLDQSLAVLETQRRQQGSTLGRITSIRDFAPTDREAEKRVEFISRFRKGELRRWDMPARPPALEEIPQVLTRGLVAQDESGQFLIPVFPSVERRQGENAMAFTEELYSLDLPATLRGPAGETVVLAEILWLVTGEGPWLVGLTFLGVFLLILVHRRSMLQTLWILLPLVAGIALTLGVVSYNAMSKPLSASCSVR
jgi:predicted RND superfamily exporter protein